ncbi:MAG: SMP-30/gluconolactonase/LRE family protein [Phenylobacterium sp.]|uniref:SMP-30/gluconolactonase/LRE family protein n=1 Tax=Phenylobacterium sp. TaxID=1871053 RepID=UPI0025FBC69F|nr:SMP-30/gluconolactonase/LRE family protein [Phenylobacterium sp.]MBI1197796.1 SMP-30/gluconolactonase/LRE family protein [Phenylobacterium sp.]
MRVVTDRLRFPEGPIALPDGSVVVVEIEGRALTRVRPDGRLEIIAELEGGPNGAAMGPDGWCYVCNSGGWIYTSEANGWRRPLRQSDHNGWIERVHLATGRVERLYDRCGDIALQSPNDIVFDRSGGFYFTDHGKRRPREWGITSVFYAAPDGGRIVEAVRGLVTPNGVGLSADEKTLYVAETIPRRIWAFDLEAPGVIREEPWPSSCGGRLVAGLPDNNYLDSLALDADGAIVVASFNRCGVWTVSPDGARREFLAIDDFYATNVAFGGEGLRTAFVTLSSTGRLVAIDWPRAGQPVNFVNTMPAPRGA